MANVTPELIRDISVQAVEDFLNNKIPLSQGLAKQAAAYDLNVEQVKRAVESTNNIAYLKILQHAEDRTVEFPLAKFAEVMSSATVPDNFQEKVASVAGPELQTPLTKEASAPLELVEAEKLTYMIKTASANKETLERIEIDSIAVADKLIKVAKTFSKDEAWMDKLACVTDESEFKELSVLVSGEVKNYRDLKDLGLFKQAQLKEATEFSELYKQARAMVREQRERSGLQKRAADAADSVKSNIFSKAMGSAASTAKVLNPAHLAGAALGGAASVPFRAAGAAGAAIKNSVKNNISSLSGGNKASVGNVAKAVGQTAGGVGSKILRAAGPVADAALYSPGVDSTTGRSNDVWGALQRD